MPEGLIVKALSGYYYVLPLASGEDIVQCRARGIFKKRGVSPLVGDRVIFGLTENGEGMVDEILPRTTELNRPPIANVELAFLVFAVAEPDLNTQLLDKFLVHTEKAGLQTAICLSKADLLTKPESSDLRVRMEEIQQRYEAIGYPVLRCSIKTGEGSEEILRYLSGKITVFSGQSGVGKSSLLNRLVPGLQLETNAISNKLGRGKHTTRHVELITHPSGGLIADTPGFSQLDFEGIEADELGRYFADFASLFDNCKFRGCLHRNEPDCAVAQAVAKGSIHQSRYEHYLLFLEEIRERKKRY
jgi:ribosome biogenesis GTPase